MFRNFLRLAFSLLTLMLVATSFTVAQAKAKVLAHIDLTNQRMTVYVNGSHYATWRVSTARRGYRTPRGTFRPRVLKRMHYSRKYHNSPMPHSIFFLGGYAIHGTNVISRLGTPASHGCVRLHPSAAAKLFALVKRYGMSSTRIRITGSPRYTPWRKKRKLKRPGWKKRKLKKRRNFSDNEAHNPVRLASSETSQVAIISSSGQLTPLRLTTFD